MRFNEEEERFDESDGEAPTEGYTCQEDFLEK